MECFSSPRRARTTILCVSFGAIFLWILLGGYVRHEDPAAALSRQAVPERAQVGRHLLSSEDVLLEESCDGMYYEKSGKNVSASDQCSKIHGLNSNFSSCDFIKCVDGCSSGDGLLDYLGFIYCTMPSKLIPLAMVLLFLWLIFLFIFLGATAEEYFCPSLTVISAILRLSQNVAGVTLLALGNGAPDIFSAFAAVNQDEDAKASLAIGALFGAGMFVTTIVVGAVTVTKPLTLTQRPFLRDIIFYIFAVFWTFYLLWSNSMTIFNAVGFVALYIFYVAVVIVGRVIFQKWKKYRNTNKLGTGDMPRPPTPPEGEEMGHSNTTTTTTTTTSNGGLATLGALLPGMGIAGSYSQREGPMANGRINSTEEEREMVDTATEEEEEEEEGGERGEGKGRSKEPKLFRITSVGSSEFSTSLGPVHRPIIRIQGESDGEGSPLFPKMSIGEQRRARELAEASVPPLMLQTEHQHQKLHSGSHSYRGGYGYGYGAIPVGIQSESGSRSPSPTRRHKSIRKTISGALDVTEGIGAAFGIPHVPELWEEVNRGHSRRRSASSRSHTRSTRSAVGEEGSSHTVQSPLLGPALTVPGVTRVEAEDDSTSDSEEGESDMTPVIKLQSYKRRHSFILLLLALWPFGESFKELGLLGKIYEICKSPAGLLLTLTVPVIDTNEDNHNWNKWLNVLHCVTAPVFISLITKQGLINIGGVFPVWTLLLIIGVFVAIVVACTSRSDKPPIYHCVFAWVGFAVAVIWIYSIANEIVSLLQAFGVVIKLSDGILGLTLLAWGNSIGDAVSNVTMAKQGFPRMAIGACFGGPLLNMLLGIGIASVVKSIRRKADGFQFNLIFTQVELFAALFLMLSLVCTLVTVSALKFRLKRFYGIFLVAVYVVFLTIAILAEAKVFQIYIHGVITVENDE